LHRTPFALLCLCLALLAGCASGLRIDDSHPSIAQDSRVRYVVVHYTSAGPARSLQLLTQGDVSAHYLIDADPPTVYRLVDENRRAWHAGESEWQGRTWLNATSIGIELINPGYEVLPDGSRRWYPYSDAQIDKLILLLADIVRRHHLPLGSVVGHSDIAPQRKVDPGPLFPWKRLADAGLVPWPDPAQVAAHRAVFDQALPSVLWFQQQLAIQGYAVAQNGVLDAPTRHVIAAFQMKYRPQRFDGEPDAETAAMLLALNLAHPPAPGSGVVGSGDLDGAAQMGSAR
jgi:N-acetylmuramoyl-L-alanine amidase